jgi:hypothetical protein
MTLSAAASAAHGAPFRFLDLPAEIRKEIYRYLLVFPVISIRPRRYDGNRGYVSVYGETCFEKSITAKDFVVDFAEGQKQSEPKQVLHTNALCVNRQINQEAVVALYAENVFKLTFAEYYCAFFGSLNPEHANMITRIALEADRNRPQDPFESFYHWYGRLDKVEEALDLRRRPFVNTKTYLHRFHSIHFADLKRLELHFQIGSHLFCRGTYQQLKTTGMVKRNEQAFEEKLRRLDRLRKTLDEAATYKDEHERLSAKQPPPLILEVEHSEADSSEVVLGIQRRTDIRPGYVTERDDPMKQKLHDLNQMMLRLRDERIR